MKRRLSARMSWALAGGILSVGFALFCRFSVIRFRANVYDEGLIALGAVEVLEGRWPLVDFYTPYPPAAFFALALIYQFLGASLFVERVFSATLVAVAIGLAFRLALSAGAERSRRGPLETLAAAFPMAAAGVLLGAVWVTPQVAGALVFILLAANVLLNALNLASVRGAALTGLMLGMAALWRADLAFYAAFASALVWLMRASAHRTAGFLAMTAAAAISALPVLGVFLAWGGLRAVQSLLLWPVLGTYHATLPWPDLMAPSPPTDIAGQGVFKMLAVKLANWWAYFPFVGLMAAVWQFGRFSRRADSRRSLALWLVISGLGFGIYAGGRSDFTHFIPLLFVSLISVAVCSIALLRDHPGYLKWGGLTVTLLAVGALVPTPLDDIRTRRSAANWSPMPFERTRGILEDKTWVDNYVGTVKEIVRSTAAGEPIFSGSSRHDVFMVNDNLLYFVSERPPATYFWCLDAAVTTNEPVQAQMIDEMTRRGVRLAVRLANVFEVADFHKDGGGSLQLDQWLDASFPAVVQTGGYTLQVQRSD